MYRQNYLAGGCGMLLVVTTQATLADSTPATASAQAAGYLAQLVGGLVLVILLILAMAWLLRRMPGLVVQGSPVIEILAVRAVGSRERLLLVQVGAEQLLVGLTPAGLCHLHTLHTPIVISSLEPQPGDFAKLFNKIRSSGLKR